MKSINAFAVALIGIALLAGPLSTFAADQKAKAKLKPYPLKTCVVTDEKLGGMGDAYVFEYEGREIKLCCKGCLKDFKKDPAKYVKKLETAEAKEKQKAKK